MPTSAGLEEARFIRDGDAWLFTAANPWIVGPRRTYRVNDEQKAALVVRVRRAKWVMLGLIVPVLAVLVFILVQAPWLARPETVTAWLVLGAFTLAIAGFLIATESWCLRPMLRGLPRSSAKVSRRDMFRKLRDTVSVRTLLIFLAIFSLSFLVQAFGMAISSRRGAFDVINLGMSGLFTAVCIGMLVGKLRARQAAADVSVRRDAERG
jgi:hypothetical protein